MHFFLFIFTHRATFRGHSHLRMPQCSLFVDRYSLEFPQEGDRFALVFLTNAKNMANCVSGMGKSVIDLLLFGVELLLGGHLDIVNRRNQLLAVLDGL